ncbi:MAG: PEP/pyruvate-binding domain-containing protein [Nanoarchaeota archaeon]|nr:PEP/pyruvate-binding domain-containing protein [Nanoarchaeota archaeon]
MAGDKFVKWFSELKKTDKKIVGEKGANLSEIYNSRFPVPRGFVITIQGYEEFLLQSGLKEKIKELLQNLDYNNSERLKEACEKIRKLIINAEFAEELKEEILDSYENLGTDKVEIEQGSAYEILNNANEPPFVSIRSSLINPINIKIREQDSYLNVKGNEQILYHIKKSFASLFREKTIKRFLKNKEFNELKIAIIVQEMIQGDRSGKIYSKDSSKNISIEAIWGLGEGMNIEEISPDKYSLSSTLEILDKKIGDKKFAIIRTSSGKLKKVNLKYERSIHEVLTKYEIQRLGDLGQKAEKHFGTPQELEFVIDENEIYIVQSKNLKFETLEFLMKENKEVKKENKEIEKIDKITKTEVKLILDSPYLMDEARKSGIKNIGLLKIEKIIENSGKHLNYYIERGYTNEYENIIFKGLKDACDNLNEIYVRLSDVKTDEYQNLEDAPKKENNPLLGLHGIKYLLKNQEILTAEIDALKKIGVAKNELGILLPNISSINELKKFKQILEKIGYSEAKLGIIIETPSSVQLIKDFIDEGIQFVLIDSDKLSTHLLGIDKNNKKVSEFFEEDNKAFTYQLDYFIRVCKRRNIETNIMGSVLKNKEILKEFIKKGIDAVVVQAEYAKQITNNLDKIEEEVIKGTDKEPREYEMRKEVKERDMEVEEKDKLEETNEKQALPNISQNTELKEKKIEDDLEAIEEEKKEYLKEHPDEIISEVNEQGEEIKDNIKHIKEYPEEKFEHEPEKFD